MARTVSQIKAQLYAELANQQTLGNLTDLNSPSMAAIYKTWFFIQAVAMAFTDQLWDAYKLSIEQYAASTPPASPLWVQSKVFLYQYDSSGITNTNVVTILSDFSIGYLTINPLFNIITRCSIVTTANNTVAVTVAQSEPPAIITGTAFTQLDSYLTQILPAGINHSLFSGNSDKLAIFATVYYLPGFGGVIQANVEAALNNYLDNISIASPTNGRPVNYKGLIKVSEIENAILLCEGVGDVLITKIVCRADTTLFANGTVIYDLSANVNLRQYTTVAGYAVEETTPTYDWGIQITYTPA